MLPSAVWAVVSPNGTLDSVEWLCTSLKNIATPSFLRNPPRILCRRRVDWWLETVAQMKPPLYEATQRNCGPLPLRFPWAENPVTCSPTASIFMGGGESSLGSESFLKPTAWVIVMRALWSLEGKPRLNKWAYRKIRVPRSGGEPRSAMCLFIFIEINYSLHLICSSREYSLQPPPHPSKLHSEEPQFSMQLWEGIAGS